YIRTRTCTRTHTQIPTHTHKLTHTHRYPHTHTHIHTLIHTQIPTEIHTHTSVPVQRRTGGASQLSQSALLNTTLCLVVSDGLKKTELSAWWYQTDSRRLNSLPGGIRRKQED